MPPAPKQPVKLAWWKRPLPVGIAAFVVGAGLAGAGASNTKNDSATPAQTVTATAVTTVANPGVTATVTQKVVGPTTVKTATVRVTYTPPPVDPITDGQYLVGPEVKPGLYHTDGTGDGGGCYWERLSDLNGGISSTIANDNISGPTTIQIRSSDAAFKTSGGCTWSRIG